MTIIEKQEQGEGEDISYMSMELEMVDLATAFEYYANEVLFKSPVQVSSITKGKSAAKFIIYFNFVKEEDPVIKAVEQHRSRQGVVNPDLRLPAFQGQQGVRGADDIDPATLAQRKVQEAEAEDEDDHG